MNKCYVLSIFGAGLICLCLKVSAQSIERIPYREKKVQFSTLPGVSTAGFESAKYTFNFSFNLFSGMTAGTRYFSFGTISNLGTRSSSGIQLAGIANIVGTHSYIHLTNYEQKKLENEGKTPNQKGIQLAGFLNLVRGESSGIQMTAGMNSVYRNASGFHLGGIANYAGGNMLGVQFSGLYNVTKRLVIGGQFGAVNVAGSRLSGIQIGVLNRAKLVEGKANNTSVKSFGLQVGLINHSKTNNGYQFGLINRAKRMRGVQVGLINLFTPAPYDGANRYNGIPIGLINFGSTDNRLRISRSDVLPFTIEYTTGNCHNCSFTKSSMPIDDAFYKTNQNALIFGYDYWNEAEIRWAAGYGFHRMYYNKSSGSENDPNNMRSFLSPAIRFVHLNKAAKYDPTLSLLTQLRFEAGIRLKRYTLFVGANANAYLTKRDEPLNVSREVLSKRGKINYQVWPGFVYGLILQMNYPGADNLGELIKYIFRS